ncbi:hypothetical protein G6F65_014495 [Rhizopus arrhizus]|nr:hypothetical protein G6F65_014495 [Rhizopus arrhizus]
MPSAHGALSAGSAMQTKAWVPSTNTTCRRGRRLFGLSVSLPALRSAGRSALPKARARPDSGLPASESGCSTHRSPKRGASASTSSIGVMRSAGSSCGSSASTSSFCRAKISSRQRRRGANAAASSHMKST